MIMEYVKNIKNEKRNYLTSFLLNTNEKQISKKGIWHNYSYFVTP